MDFLWNMFTFTVFIDTSIIITIKFEVISHKAEARGTAVVQKALLLL